MALKSINQDDLRNHNLSVVLSTLLQSPKPMSRAKLAKSTGLTKATMSLLVPMLIASEALEEGKPVAAGTTYGRPSTPLNISGRRYCSIGLQINTDGYGFTILALDGTVVDERWVSRSMVGSDPDEVFDQFDELVSAGERKISEKGLKVVGTVLALPGLVTDDMVLLSAKNLGWKQLELSRFNVVKRLDALADNEANLAALAQIPGYATPRGGKSVIGPTDSFIYISTDIGIGGAVVRHGQVDRGDSGFAGELGHVSVALDGPQCACGRCGCLEMYAGRKALVEASGVAEPGVSTRMEEVDEVLARYKAHDDRTVAAVDRAVRALVSVLASAINILDIDTVVLGGLWDRFGKTLTRRIRHELELQILSYPEVQPRVLLPDVNTRPALLGAAQVGLRRFIDNPLAFMNS
ncbi:ROK family protein [Bifidobacterium sp. ESL0798]|uniref:ROK family protein n=1 Tax=unclassified Bifidobacterium TaxID=2608897 RepID=UPI0023F6FAC0|nr:MULTISPECIES: ROK family protein [unclassified Bifidobacterium]WEV52517.1 ROK family protein [Bifidobacterium sp. ESL0704]WEV74506.1 ROK family protein [Bifidobacterium sp. ESL0798]